MLQNQVDLKAYTTIRTSSIASQFTTVTTRDELIQEVQDAISKAQRFIILGSGSNTVFGAAAVDALVIKNLYAEFTVVEQTDKEATITVSSGMPVSVLIAKTIELGLEGFEYHQGLPGTVGGAIYMNSKWTRPLQYFGDRLISATVIDEMGQIQTVDKTYFEFAYDYSSLQKNGAVLIDCTFRLPKQNSSILRSRATEALEYRKQTQPFGVASSGCTFQNYDGNSAGQLIDQCGLKGFHVGKFVVSPTHANFIVNEGDADVQHLIELVQHIKTTVKEKTGVELKEEIRIIT